MSMKGFDLDITRFSHLKRAFLDSIKDLCVCTLGPLPHSLDNPVSGKVNNSGRFTSARRGNGCDYIFGRNLRHKASMQNLKALSPKHGIKTINHESPRNILEHTEKRATPHPVVLFNSRFGVLRPLKSSMNKQYVMRGVADGTAHLTMDSAAACDWSPKQLRLIWMRAAYRLAVAALLSPLACVALSLGYELDCFVKKLDGCDHQAQPSSPKYAFCHRAAGPENDGRTANYAFKVMDAPFKPGNAHFVTQRSHRKAA